MVCHLPSSTQSCWRGDTCGPSQSPLPFGALPHCGGQSGHWLQLGLQALGTCAPGLLGGWGGEEAPPACPTGNPEAQLPSEPHDPQTGPACLVHSSPVSLTCVPPPQITDPCQVASGGPACDSQLGAESQKRDPCGHSGVPAQAWQGGCERKVWECFGDSVAVTSVSRL